MDESNSMNKRQFADYISETYGISQVQARERVDMVFDAMIRALVTRKADRIAITGVGVFERVQYKAKNAWNLATNTRLRIEERVSVRFRAGTAFKALMRGEQELPVGRSAAQKAARRKADTPEES